MNTLLRRLRATVSVALISMSLAGCIGSVEPLGGNGDGAMTLTEVHALLGPEGRKKLNFSEPPAGKGWAERGFLLLESKDKSFPVRLFPFRTGIVVEVAPFAWGQPFFLYGAVLPHRIGGAFFMDEFQLVTAHKGGGSPAAQRALPQARAVSTYHKHKSGFELMVPRDLEGVIETYAALAAAGEKPMNVIPFDRRVR